MTDELLHGLVPELPSLTLFFLFCSSASIATTIYCVRLVYYNPWRILRPAVMVAAWVNVFFQWPLVIFAASFERALPNAWLFGSAINISPLVFLLWSAFTKRLDLHRETQVKPEFNFWQVAIPIVFSFLFATAYLARVPFDCTAAFAMLFDPEMSLIAREFAGKIAATRLSGYSFGAMVNTTAPVGLAMLVWCGVLAARRERFLVLAFCAVISCVLIGLILLSGTKGLLVPSVLVLAVSSGIWSSGKWRKLFAIVSMVSLLVLVVVGFEVVRERGGGGETRPYQFASCSMRLGQCEQSRELVESVLQRAYSLGLSPDRVKRLVEEFIVICPGTGLVVEGTAVGEAVASHVPENDVPASEPLTSEADVQSDHAEDKPSPVIVPPSIDIVRIAEQMKIFAEAIAYRAFVVPVQVGSWYFLYQAEMGKPGYAAFPAARLIADSSVNMPEAVYQKYGSIYAGGDRTSTSTAPTSSLLAYPAYVGWLGIVIAVVAIVFLDLVWSNLLRWLPSPLLSLAAGLVTILSMNFVLSDFVTALTTHGGAIAIVLLIAFVLVGGRWRNTVE